MLSYAINTDYETSAAEDLESFKSPVKYKNADWALLAYARTNKLDKLKCLLDAKLNKTVDVNLNFTGQQKRNYTWTALHLACYFGHIDIVCELLSRDEFRNEIDINLRNNSGDTPLHKATLTNRVEIVQLLLSKEANIFVKNCDGLLAKQLTTNNDITEMLNAAEQSDKIKIKQSIFKAVDNGELHTVQTYFDNYGPALARSNPLPETESTKAKNSITSDKDLFPNCLGYEDVLSEEPFNQMVDDRGNTLLHIATMRGFEGICIYLLEQGLEPHRPNNQGKSCIDLASSNLRKLFLNVKPSNAQLKKLTKSRVTRFEGPLLKKVRILGWKAIYVVIDNGVILLFNNQSDSMNKSRRGYKYLESAYCLADMNDVGMFTICFSDKSRATFLITNDHLKSYTLFRTSPTEVRDRVSGSIISPMRKQVELVRQKWLDALQDHIQYSTEFISRGLRFNDYDDDYMTTDQLLPIETIKSITQEARAHYSILERHSDMLRNLIKSIVVTASNRDLITSSQPPGQTTQKHVNQCQPDLVNLQSSSGIGHQMSIQTSVSNNPSTQVSTTITGSRLFGLIKTSKQVQTTVEPIQNISQTTSGDNLVSSSTSIISAVGDNRRPVSDITSTLNQTKEFLQNDWHCIEFHLNLLLESAANTNTSMGQAVSLIENQENIRQQKIKDLQESCRILGDSLQTLARNHHELERSLSMSQLYHSVANRSISLSTDLDEYFDAFDDFDDEKTMTPTSMPSYEDLNRVVNDDKFGCGTSSKYNQPKIVDRARHTNKIHNEHHHRYGDDDDDDGEEVDDDDASSNCSALTDRSTSEFDFPANLDVNRNTGINMHRTNLPAPMVPRDQISFWSILKHCIGKELSRITMPVVFNEPLTMLQRTCETVQYADLLKMADLSKDPIEAMELVCAFIVAGVSSNSVRIVKPFNPLLYETYEFVYTLNDGSEVKAMSQQVCHHPPITATIVESNHFTNSGSLSPKIKFKGTTVDVQPDAQCKIYLKTRKESYYFKSIHCLVSNIIIGTPSFEHYGLLEIKCPESKIKAGLDFKSAGWFGDKHRFDGIMTRTDSNGNETKVRYLYGKWTDYIKSIEYSEYKNYLKANKLKTFKIPDKVDPTSSKCLISDLRNAVISSTSREADKNKNVNQFSISSSMRLEQGEKEKFNDSTRSSKAEMRRNSSSKGEYEQQTPDMPNSQLLWISDAQYLEEYYNFTYFTLQMNELTKDLEKQLPRTDSRFRSDVRLLEEGNIDGAANEKDRLENKQREARARDNRFKEPSLDFLWFEQSNQDPTLGDKAWLYRGGYWENKNNEERFPDIM